MRNLAGPVLDDDVPVLAYRSSLLRVGLGRSGIGLRLEMMLFVRHDRCRNNIKTTKSRSENTTRAHRDGKTEGSGNGTQGSVPDRGDGGAEARNVAGTGNRGADRGRVL
ncbi:hypothetical protein BHE74_00007659 [Ensete ventricosum]|uniref:Uncharacterized protein n=1 Tax=Ensete ventricosum TaxID=4639 RepID=A0A444EEL3_ENSVE|nr:hypothetical protein B296_00006668 [Ensete ventricosum]RWW08754.1 hypothetical protein GW17_00027783 [Ensete ventricosum]RWW83819.1 hypothetical protein BHE74_00007659 [Ensete ventricosum]